MAIYKLKEANYGGAYDIDPEMFFTKEELLEFGQYVAEEFNKITRDNADLSDIYFSDESFDNRLCIELEDAESMYDTCFFIDMRRIRLPKDIYKYTDKVLHDLTKQYSDYQMYESYKLKESDDYDPEAYDTDDIWTVVCMGDLENVKRLVKDYETANKRYNAFGMDHSLIMGAARNNEPEVVSYLIRVGGTIEPSETAEFATFVKKNGNKIDLWG